jgi:hypothetical protein
LKAQRTYAPVAVSYFAGAGRAINLLANGQRAAEGMEETMILTKSICLAFAIMAVMATYAASLVVFADAAAGFTAGLIGRAEALALASVE